MPTAKHRVCCAVLFCFHHKNKCILFVTSLNKKVIKCPPRNPAIIKIFRIFGIKIMVVNMPKFSNNTMLPLKLVKQKIDKVNKQIAENQSAFSLQKNKSC